MQQISLAAVRVNADFTQEELAKIMNVDRQTIINWERGHTRISGEYLLMFAEACNFSIVDIRLPKLSLTPYKLKIRYRY